jgi:hypothetical protein
MVEFHLVGKLILQLHAHCLIQSIMEVVEARNSGGNTKNNPIADVQPHKSWLVIAVFT